MGKYRLFLKDSIVFAFGSLGTKLILFFLVPLYTNYLTPNEYGTADLIFSYATLIAPIISVSIGRAVQRYGMVEGVQRENLIRTAMTFLVVGIVVSIIFTGALSLYKEIAQWRWYLGIQIILQAIVETEEMYLLAKEQNRKYVGINILQTLTLATISILLIRFFRLGVKGYLLSQNIACGAIVVVCFFAAGIYRDLPEGNFDSNLLKIMLLFSLPIMVNDIFWWALQSVDRVFIKVMLGASVLGIYTAASKMRALMNIVIGIFNQSWTISSIREAEGENENVFFSRIFKMYSVALIGVCMMSIALIKPVMSVFVGDDFSDAWRYTPFLLVGSVGYAIGVYYSSVYIALKKTINDMLTMAFGAAVDFGLCFVLIPVVGLWGAVIAALAGNFAYAHSKMLDIGRYIKIEVRYKSYVMDLILLFVEALAVTFEIHAVSVSVILILVFLIEHRGDIRQITNWIVRRVL